MSVDRAVIPPVTYVELCRRGVAEHHEHILVLTFVVIQVYTKGIIFIPLLPPVGFNLVRGVAILAHGLVSRLSLKS
ncbi:hypothetical protein BMS3Bbin04_01455 [bacterium BMS3Bbin04]|nr:hypothetical protein BMS3Bbin04_01455 [bacterium BMS3Bbin04]